ncbi:hypothetical protein HPB48_013621 [Haemaphysalis longicornis]|uniref:Uncharacterized protein n=1 Tax=Haemaphysalis longicornis TaxID=44386 RepID=A0A9J6H071_HAELO|nr:hypothetical protein HPB48_013621 [Haemaphysalis longicornis]
MGLLNCTLTSTMLVRKTTDYVDSFEDLLRFPGVKISTEKLTYFSAILKVKFRYSSARLDISLDIS